MYKDEDYACIIYRAIPEVSESKKSSTTGEKDTQAPGKSTLDANKNVDDELVFQKGLVCINV